MAEAKTTEQRLAFLEAALKAEQAKSEQALKDNKRLKAQLTDATVAARQHIGTLNSMRDVSENDAYKVDAREKYEELKRTTVKTKDGMAHYFSPGATNVDGVHYPEGGFVTIPADRDPSVTWKPCIVGGKDPKTGKLIFAVAGDTTEADEAEALAENQVDGPLTNTEINDKRAAGNRRLAAMGAGAAPVPAARASDTDVG